MTWFLVLLFYHDGLNAPSEERRIAMPSLEECRLIAGEINNGQNGDRAFVEAKCRPGGDAK